VHWYLDVLKKYAVFRGRADCKEYWMYTLFSLIIAVPLYLLGMAIGSPIPVLIYCVAVLLPSLGVTVRRLHDTGKSGWAVLIGIVPILGDLALLVFTATAGDPGRNKYGEDPKAVAAVAASPA